MLLISRSRVPQAIYLRNERKHVKHINEDLAS